jgi:small subunit ribosomal protein S8e
MARSQDRSKRKASGGRYVSFRSKKKSELVGFSANTKIGEKKVKTKRTLGGNLKKQHLAAQEINVADKGKVKKAVIKNVLENEANPHLVRRNILTKGAVVETDLGKVKITSRPGQESVLNGVLVK